MSPDSLAAAGTEDLVRSLNFSAAALRALACAMFVLASVAPLALARAQAFAPDGAVAATRPSAMLATPQAAPDPRWAPRVEVPVRVLAGVAGSAAGAMMGILAGVALPHADCRCDDPSLGNALLGGAIGTVVSGAWFSAMPAMGSSCGFGARFASAALGGTLGAVAGGFLGPHGGAGTIYGYVGGSGIGAGVGAWLCSR